MTDSSLLSFLLCFFLISSFFFVLSPLPSILVFFLSYFSLLLSSPVLHLSLSFFSVSSVSSLFSFPLSYLPFSFFLPSLLLFLSMRPLFLPFFGLFLVPYFFHHLIFLFPSFSLFPPSILPSFSLFLSSPVPSLLSLHTSVNSVPPSPLFQDPYMFWIFFMKYQVQNLFQFPHLMIKDCRGFPHTLQENVGLVP